MNNTFLILSTIVGFITPLLGVYFIWKGSYRPQRMTRFLIMIIMMLFVGTLYASGDKNGIYLATAQLLGNVILFILSLKYGMGGLSKFDFAVFIMAVLSLIIWQTTQNPIVGLCMSIITDFTAFSPTLIKAWKQPQTEDWRFYTSDIFAGLFSILGITTLSPQNLAFPLYILLINIICVSIILKQGIPMPSKAG